MRSHPHFRAYLALSSVCFFWGTTYLGIRIALESFPPLLLISTRFLLSGSILLAFLLARGSRLPRGRELFDAALCGTLILGVGNGALVYSELWIPSGLAGLFITMSPFWLVGIEALVPGGGSLHAPTIGGMLVGLAGAGLLFTPGVQGQSMGRNVLAGFLILQLGSASWSFGSIYQRRRPSTSGAFLIAALHQLAAGLMFLAPALLIREKPVVWDARGVAALVYLATFGSIIGYSSYLYALERLPLALVSIYPYANAVVAVVLGWLFYREPFGWREGVAMAFIFTGVALVRRFSSRA